MTRKFISFVAAAAAAALGACQTAQPQNTPSGKPEVQIRSSIPAVKSALISRGMTRGYTVTRDTEFMLQLDRPSENLAAAFLLGSRYDGTPNERLIFNFADVGGEIRVVGNAMFVTNPGSAFERITPVNGGPAADSLQSALVSVKRDIEAAAIQANPPPRRRAAGGT